MCYRYCAITGFIAVIRMVGALEPETLGRLRRMLELDIHQRLGDLNLDVKATLPSKGYPERTSAG